MKKDEFRRHPAFPAIKGAQRDLIRDIGGIDRAARLLGKSPSLVGNWNNLDTPDLMGVSDIAVLECELGRPVVSRAQAAATGATTIDPVGVFVRGCLPTAATAVMAGCSSFMGEWARAAEDGEYTPNELYAIRPKIRDVERAARETGGLIDRMISDRLQEIEP